MPDDDDDSSARQRLVLGGAASCGCASPASSSMLASFLGGGDACPAGAGGALWRACVSAWRRLRWVAVLSRWLVHGMLSGLYDLWS